jgi:hypothetical protein
MAPTPNKRNIVRKLLANAEKIQAEQIKLLNAYRANSRRRQIAHDAKPRKPPTRGASASARRGKTPSPKRGASASASASAKRKSPSPRRPNSSASASAKRKSPSPCSSCNLSRNKLNQLMNMSWRG